MMYVFMAVVLLLRPAGPAGRAVGAIRMKAQPVMAILRHPVTIVLLVLIALTLAWLAIGAPISLITQIAIYMLYGAGVNLLVGYTGLVPFGASVFFGCASYAVAISMRDFLGNEAEALIFAIAVLPRARRCRSRSSSCAAAGCISRC